MSKIEKEIENIFLDDEEEVIKKLEDTYKKSLEDVKKHAKKLQNELNKLLANADEDDEQMKSMIRSKVYQLEYQKKLSKQINNYLDVIKSKNINDITEYLKKVYGDGFLTEQYRLMNQGINITMPINQKLLVKAVTYQTENIPLSKRLYENVEKAKKDIISEISRGLSIGASQVDMARNLENTMGVSIRKALQIAQNEGQRVRQEAIIDSMHAAKDMGADIVKQWSARLDRHTRPVHQELDGKWVEVDDYFEYSGGKVFAPKQFGIPSQDINCRCTLLMIPRWDIAEEHWQIDNETGEVVKVKNYQEWYGNYQIKETASQMINKAKREEPVITNVLKDIVNNNGGYLEGLENRLKSKDSLIRKMTTEINIEGKTIEESANKMFDIVRYTGIFGNENLVDGYNKTIHNLESMGYNILRCKNTFTPNSVYKGINCVIETPSGYKFELQFHTKQSLEIKEANHILYEKYRLDSIAESVKEELAKEMRENSNKISTPIDIELIKSLDKLKKGQ